MYSWKSSTSSSPTSSCSKGLPDTERPWSCLPDKEWAWSWSIAASCRLSPAIRSSSSNSTTASPIVSSTATAADVSLLAILDSSSWRTCSSMARLKTKKTMIAFRELKHSAELKTLVCGMAQPFADRKWYERETVTKYTVFQKRTRGMLVAVRPASKRRAMVLLLSNGSTSLCTTTKGNVVAAIMSIITLYQTSMVATLSILGLPTMTRRSAAATK
mmetsp:Transcript_44133/g.137433  ORF Transcript_44133/g.137433 Transcript_44133/m.137433 type:complete len:216 (+) Transcript_44133:853-1500(+)